MAVEVLNIESTTDQVWGDTQVAQLRARLAQVCGREFRALTPEEIQRAEVCEGIYTLLQLVKNNTVPNEKLREMAMQLDILGCYVDDWLSQAVAQMEKDVLAGRESKLPSSAHESAWKDACDILVPMIEELKPEGCSIDKKSQLHAEDQCKSNFEQKVRERLLSIRKQLLGVW